jgi:hypothetical protein
MWYGMGGEYCWGWSGKGKAWGGVVDLFGVG